MDSNCIHSPPDSIAIFFSLALKSKIQKFVYRIHFYIFIFLFVSFLTHLCVGIRVCFFSFGALRADTATAGLARAKVLAYQLLK